MQLVSLFRLYFVVSVVRRDKNEGVDAGRGQGALVVLFKDARELSLAERVLNGDAPAVESRDC